VLWVKALRLLPCPTCCLEKAVCSIVAVFSVRVLYGGCLPGFHTEGFIQRDSSPRKWKCNQRAFSFICDQSVCAIEKVKCSVKWVKHDLN